MSIMVEFYKKTIVIILIFCCAWEPSLAQQSYVLARQKNNDHDDDQYAIMEFNVLTGERDILFELIANRFAHSNETGWTRIMYSFEFSNDMQQVYFLEREGDLYKYDIASDELTYIMDLTPATTPFNIHFHTLTFQLDRVNDSILLVSGYTYGLYNENTQSFTQTYVVPDFPSASLPRQMEIVATRTARHKDGFVYNGGCVCLNQADINDPNQNVVLFDYDVTPDISVALENIVSYQYDCDSTQLYFVDVADSLRIWEIDEENGDLSLYDAYCNFSVKHEYALSDVQHYNATPWEDCQRLIDLDEDDSSGAINIDYNNDSLCVHTDISIVDIDVQLKNEQVLDSIVIYIAQPLTGQRVEIQSGNYNILRQSDSYLSIIDNGTTSLLELEQALISARYIDDQPYRSGDIEVIFEPWYRGVAGTAAISYLHIPEIPYAGEDIFLEFCVEELVIDLADLLEPNVTEGFYYTKEGVPLSNSIVDLFIEQELSLIYISGSEQCIDTACIEVLVHPLPETIMIEDIVLCEGDSMTIDLSALDGQIIWSDGNEEKIRTLQEASDYSYDLMDAFGCITTESFSLSYVSIEVQEEIMEVEICAGESYPYNGDIYEQDTYLVDTIQSVQGCDSLISGLSLTVIEEIDIMLEGAMQFCEGATTMIELVSEHVAVYLDDALITGDIEFSEAGTYVLRVEDIDGCAEEMVIEISSYPEPAIELVDISNLEFVETQEIDVSYIGDLVRYTWLPTEGLSCYDCPFPALIEPGIEQYTIEIEDIHGCISRETLNISYKENAYYLPNVISTFADDEDNRSFHLMSNQQVLYDMIIYDRWGNVMYEAEGLFANEPSTGWIPDDNIKARVYVYMVKVYDGQQEQVLSGSLTLVY